jgi:phage-related protein
MKQTRKTPQKEIDIARQRLKKAKDEAEKYEE